MLATIKNMSLFSPLVLTIVILLIGISGCSNRSQFLHSPGHANLPKNIGVQGYSPVSYFEKNIAEKGDPQFTTNHKGRIYYFASADQVETFKKMPKKYTPRYGEYCPYSLVLGRRVAIDPTNFKIHNGKLLLFHSSVELSTVDLNDQKDTLEKADREYNLIAF